MGIILLGHWTKDGERSGNKDEMVHKLQLTECHRR